MNIRTLPQTGSVKAVCENVRRYLAAMPNKPERVVLTRDVFLKLKDAAKTSDIDYNGVKLVSK